MLVNLDGLSGDGFDFPTNGSGSPDSAAAPATTAKLLTFMTSQTTLRHTLIPFQSWE